MEDRDEKQTSGEGHDDKGVDMFILLQWLKVSEFLPGLPRAAAGLGEPASRHSTAEARLGEGRAITIWNRLAFS